MQQPDPGPSIAHGDQIASGARLTHLPAVSVGAGAVGVQAIGALALATISLGAFAIGALAIGRLTIGKARIRRLEIDELIVRRLHVIEQLQPPSTGQPLSQRVAFDDR